VAGRTHRREPITASWAVVCTGHEHEHLGWLEGLLVSVPQLSRYSLVRS